MGMPMDEKIKRWAARRKSALVLEIIQDKTTVAEAILGGRDDWLSLALVI